MQIKIIGNDAAGTWARDCELIKLTYCNGLTIDYYKDENETYWRAHFKDVAAYKKICEELSVYGYLEELPIDGAFFVILDSPWIAELKTSPEKNIDKLKHFILRFYDETIEIVARDCFFDQLKEKPVYEIESKKI